MKTTLLLLPLVGLLLSGCDKGKPASAPSSTSGGNPITAPADYVGAVGQAQKSSVKTLATVSLDSAIKLYFNQEGRYPKSLDELVSSGTMTKLPAAPNGMKFDYDPATGQVKVVAK